jgi:hypothetical protein
MRSLFIACILLISEPSFAQFKPLCDDGMGGYKECLGTLDPALLPPLPIAKLPVVPTDKGGTGVTTATPGKYLGSVGVFGMPSFIPIDRKHIPGMSFDFSTTPGPMLEVTKDVGTGPQMISRFPGEGGTFNRWYVGRRGMYMTFNCMTGDGVICFKDSVAVPSAVWEMGNGSVLRWSIETSTGVSMWRVDAPQRAMEWTGSRPYWATDLGNGQITAWAGGTVRGARIGDVVHFPVQWPARLKRVPTRFTFGSTKVVGAAGAISVSNPDDAGAVVNVEVGSNGDFTWIGQVYAGN